MKIIILLFKLFLFQLTNSLSRKRKSEKCEIKFENQQVKVKINEEKAFDKFLDKEIEINCSNLQDVKQLTFPSIKQISIIRIINNTGIERVKSKQIDQS